MMEVHVCSRKDGVLLRAFALGDSPEVIVGRDEDCDIRIASSGVSREHCSIEQDGNDVTVRDLNSSSGVYVVRRGDSIARIAKKFSMDEAQILAINHLPNRNRIYVGQTLNLMDQAPQIMYRRITAGLPLRTID